VDLPLAAELRKASLTAVDWPLASLPEGAASDPGALVGRVVVTPILKGEAILSAKLASRESGSGLAAILPIGMRAAAVRVDDVVGVAGFLHPGDRVDVIVTMKPAEGPGVPPVSKIVLQDVRVLAVGKEIAAKGKELQRSIPATVATLMVTSEQSEKLALAAAKGQLLLTLRSSTTEPVTTAGVTPPVLLSGTASLAPRPPPPPPRRAAVPWRAFARRRRRSGRRRGRTTSRSCGGPLREADFDSGDNHDEGTRLYRRRRRGFTAAAQTPPSAPQTRRSRGRRRPRDGAGTGRTGSSSSPSR
jgi:pilus assembly protein CpaB